MERRQKYLHGRLNLFIYRVAHSMRTATCSIRKHVFFHKGFGYVKGKAFDVSGKGGFLGWGVGFKIVQYHT